MPAVTACSQYKKASHAFHDSLRMALKDLTENIKDERIQAALKQALALYTTDTITETLAANLLALQTDEYLFNKPALQIVPPYLVNKYSTLFLDLLALIKPPEQNLLYAQISGLQATWYIEAGQLDAAIILCRQALKITQQLPGAQNASLAAIYIDIAKCYLSFSKTDSSIFFFRKAADEIKRTAGRLNTVYINCLFGMAEQYRLQHNYSQVSAHLGEALSLGKKCLGEQSTAYAYLLFYAAGIYTYIPLYNDALLLATQAMEITAKNEGGENPQYLCCLNLVGEIYYALGEYEKAFYPFQHVLSTKKKIFGNDYFDNVVSLHNLATLYIRMGMYDNAYPLLQQAVSLSGKIFGTQNAVYAVELPQLAAVYQALGQFDKALPLYQQTVEIFRRSVGTTSVFYPRSLNSLAVLYEIIGQQDKAYGMMKDALAADKIIFGKSHPEYAKTLISLAGIYERSGQYAKSLALLDQALDIFKNKFGKMHPDYAATLSGQGVLYNKIGQYAMALHLQQEALYIRIKILGLNHPDVAESLNNLGLVWMNKGNYSKARSFFQQSLTIKTKIFGAGHTSLAQTHISLGELSCQLNNSEDATTHFIDASVILLDNFSKTYDALSEEEKMMLINDKPYLFSYIPSLLLKNSLPPLAAQQAYRNELALKGIILEGQSQLFERIRSSGNTNTIQLYEQWRFYRALYGRQLLLPVSERESNFDTLKETANLFEQQLARSSADFSASQHGSYLSTANIAGALQKNEAAIEFTRFKVYNKKWTDSIMYAALILLPGDTVPIFVALCEERQLAHFLNFAHNPISAIHRLYPGANAESNSKYPVDSLYRLIWQPFEKYLANISSIYYAPAGLLNRVSFQALRCGSSQMLIDKYQLHQVLSTRVLALPADRVTKITSISSWGNIDYNYTYTGKALGAAAMAVKPVNFFDIYSATTRWQTSGTWPRLPGTRLEIDSLAVMFNLAGISNTIFTDTLATEEAFKALDGKSPQVLHLATHGFFLPPRQNSNAKGEEDNQDSNLFKLQQNPMFRSGLVLAGANSAWAGKKRPPGGEDGILTAYEIAQMNLGNTNLIVLSACETALGDIEGNEGVIGLQRAFRMAGVKQMILSLWQLPDKETITLVVMLYKNLLAGQPAAQALRNAQLKMKEKYPPYYWAGFILIQ